MPLQHNVPRQWPDVVGGHYPMTAFRHSSMLADWEVKNQHTLPRVLCIAIWPEIYDSDLACANCKILNIWSIYKNPLVQFEFAVRWKWANCVWFYWAKVSIFLGGTHRPSCEACPNIYYIHQYYTAK